MNIEKYSKIRRTTQLRHVLRKPALHSTSTTLYREEILFPIGPSNLQRKWLACLVSVQEKHTPKIKTKNEAFTVKTSSFKSNCTAPSRWIEDWYAAHFCGRASSFPLTGANETILIAAEMKQFILSYQIKVCHLGCVEVGPKPSGRIMKATGWDCINKPIQSAVFLSELWNSFPPFNFKHLPSAVGNWNVNWIMSKIYILISCKIRRDWHRSARKFGIPNTCKIGCRYIVAINKT